MPGLLLIGDFFLHELKRNAAETGLAAELTGVFVGSGQESSLSACLLFFRNDNLTATPAEKPC